jgi:hypothetical protein
MICRCKALLYFVWKEIHPHYNAGTFELTALLKDDGVFFFPSLLTRCKTQPFNQPSRVRCGHSLVFFALTSVAPRNEVSISTTAPSPP